MRVPVIGRCELWQTGVLIVQVVEGSSVKSGRAANIIANHNVNMER